MPQPHSLRRARRGSALITVLLLIAVLSILTISMLQYSATEQRANERARLILRARNMSENISIYAAEQLTTKLYRLRSPSPMAFMTGTNAIALPPEDVLNTRYTDAADAEVRAGITSSTALAFIDPATNPGNPNAGLSAATSTVPIIAKATARHPVLGSVTTYTQHDLEVAMIPLFQFAVFYNMDMEFGPGADMRISGPVHTNGSLIARMQTGRTSTLEFTDRVTAVKGFFANTGHKGPTVMNDGSADNGPGGTGPLLFTKPNGTSTEIESGNVWRDHKYGTANETATTLTQFKNFATSTYAGNLRTSVHGVTALQLPSISNYKETDDPNTPEDDRNNGRQIIAAPSPSDSAGLKETKFARRAGLYIVANPDDEERTGVLPDATAVSMRARSYRCWLNTVAADGSHSLVEVVLPGQPSYGHLNANPNNLPNAYRNDTSVNHNQVLRLPKGGGGDRAGTGHSGAAIPTFPALTDSYFYDMRRATGNSGHPQSRTVSTFTPRPIAKIDFDLTRFKMAVERTILDATSSTVYNPGEPNNTTWASSVLNPSAAPASHGLGVGLSYTSFPTENDVIALLRAQNNAYSVDSITIVGYGKTGSNPTTNYSGRFTIEQTTSAPSGSPQAYATWSAAVNYPEPSADASSITYTPAANITAIRIRQYSAGAAPAAARLIDEQIIPVPRDDGTSTVVAALSNDRHVIPTNGATLDFTNAATEMRVYVGGADDTENWTFTAATQSGSITGRLGGNTSNGSTSTGYGLQGNRYTAASMSTAAGTTTGVVRITATKGATTVSRDFTLVKNTSITGFTAVSTGGWFSATTLPGPDPFRIYYAPADPNDTRIKDDPTALAVPVSALIDLYNPCPWYDGITVYIHSVAAENRTFTSGVPDRVDSGVRLWNGRGSVISLNGAIYPARTGFSFATNDAVYVIGHFNADGNINATVTSLGSGTPNFYNGYSGRYAESATEMLTSIMGDATTILSQPEFTRSGSSPGYTYAQSAGWSDSLSGHRISSSNWSSNWRTANPGGTNRYDGRETSVVPAAMPNLVSAAGSGVARTTKFTGTDTEISTCLLIGIVPTNHNPLGLTATPPSSMANGQTSGGVHNYPRLQEHWGTGGLYIRGSMVAMFESRVAMEPWSIRYYNAPGRFWGLHQSLRNANHDLPLEPMLLNARRMRFKELTNPEYAAMKTTIEALPH